MDVYSSILGIYKYFRLTQIQGEFFYREFHKNEYENYGYLDGTLYRYVKISWEIEGGNTNYVPLDLINSDSEIGEFIELESRIQFNMFSMSPVSIDSSKFHQENLMIQNVSPYRKYLEDLKNNKDVSWSDIENNFVPSYNPTTGRPIQKGILSIQDQVDRAYFPESYANYIGRSISNDPLSESTRIGSIQNQFDILTSKRREHRILKPNSTRRSNSAVLLGDMNTISSLTNSNGKIVGFLVIRRDGLSNEFQFAKFCKNKEFYDTKVSYGKKYVYSVYPVMNISGYAIAIQNDTMLEIISIENLIPDPPQDISLKYLENNRYSLTWLEPRRRVTSYNPITSQDESTFPRDVKGYQIFIRDSLDSPYKLLKYLKFNNISPKSSREYAREFIPDEYIVSYETSDEPLEIPTSYNIYLQPNKIHYITMCAIDAHGNSSNYGVQYKIRRDSVTGKITKEAISYEGAPKAQPNLFLKDTIMDSSFKVSNYQFCNVYVAPDLSDNIPDPGSSLEIQFIDTNTDVMAVKKYNIVVE